MKSYWGLESKSYWDLESKKRAQLTEQQVETYCRVELMHNGVIDPGGAPPLGAERSVELDMVTLYVATVKSKYYGHEADAVVAFHTAEAAEAFMRLEPLKIELDYSISGYGGDRNQYAVPLSSGGKVEVRRVATFESVEARRDELKKVEVVRSRNEKLRREWQEARNAADKAVTPIWEDWRELQEQKALHTRVLAALDEYTALAGGDRATAVVFLRKTYGEELVDEALGGGGAGEGATAPQV